MLKTDINFSYFAIYVMLREITLGSGEDSGVRLSLQPVSIRQRSLRCFRRRHVRTGPLDASIGAIPRG